jgi:hypothetical protein
MHGFFIAASFIAMVLAPCLVSMGFCKDLDSEA